MIYKCIFFYAIIIPLSFIGFISLMLLLLGYRPIIISDVLPDWTAISTIATILTAIGTMLAVFTALFITKLQDKINNRKELSISWLFVEKQQSGGRLLYPDISNNHHIDELCVQLINTGNRKIIINGVFIELSPQTFIHLHIHAIKTKDIPFPCILEPEMASEFYVLYNIFLGTIKTAFEDGYINANSNIIVSARDTTGKTYSYKTNQKYSYYLAKIRDNSELTGFPVSYL